MSTQTYTYDFSRWFAIPPVALAVTLALLLLMHLLVFMEVPDTQVEAPKPMPPIVMEKSDPIEVIDNKPKRVEDPAPPPAIPEQPAIITPGNEGTITHIEYRLPPGGGPVKITLGGQLVPHFKVQPNYPIRAASRNIEGYVVVEFDVTELGTTDNIRVVVAEPENMFEKSVIQAVQRWKYNPKQDNGVPVRAYSLRERISFTLNP